MIVFPAEVFNHPNHNINLYGDNIEVDYRGYDVTVENFIRLLTARQNPHTPLSKTLQTDDRSNILIYMTGLFFFFFFFFFFFIFFSRN